ncbi:pantothenate kinase [Sphaceloma murrayae]|uniref:Pantothenate kinase n=1 Tax=Sphaceloma murrayae TaxID=2082308 RepID=A0A2K1QU05_9PEZI|nr:pantothenate kinase [Sphaceloma murrayae]
MPELASPRPSKRRRLSSSAAEMASAILEPGSIKINVSGAYITPSSPPSSGSSSPTSSGSEPAFEQDKRDIRLPNHTAVVSHVAADIGGSLAKVVYFAPETGRGTGKSKGKGGRLHFLRFETDKIDACIEFLRGLQVQQRRRAGKKAELCVMATGGGAFKYYDRIKERLGVDVIREDEMECLIKGLDFFITEIPREVFTYDDKDEEEPMRYLEEQPHVYPYLLVNIGSGVSMIKVEGVGRYQRIGGTSLGGGTLWGLLSLLTGARTFDEMLAMSEKGDNASVDLLVGDIYGAGMGYEKIGLSERTIASSFGKVFKLKREAERDAEDGKWLSNGDDDANGHSEVKGEQDGGHEESKRRTEVGDGRMFNSEDMSRSLLYAVSNNIGQIAYLQSEKHNLERIYFGGSFIRGHRQTIHTLSFAIKFWSKGLKQAYFLRHEGYLGAVGAFLKRQPANWGRRNSVDIDVAVEEQDE